MENRRSYYQIILDRSGSMNSFIEPTVEGVNQQIKRIKEISERFPDQELVTSLAIFNHTLSHVWTNLKSSDLKELTFSDYRPEGNTALFDAIGFTLNSMMKQAGQEIENNEATAVVVIVTDGWENASRNFTHKDISDLIKKLTATGKWVFSYLGATLDAVEVAQGFNISPNNAMHYDIFRTSAMHYSLSDHLTKYIESKQYGKIKKDFIKGDEE